MNEFAIYFRLGIMHITDLGAYDHILFVVTLCSVYRIFNIIPLAGQITAFTIGHSISLALAVLNVLTLQSGIIEFAIPITIMLTAIYHALVARDSFKLPNRGFSYAMALIFGLIHGLGFSNYLKALLGQQSNIGWPLFAFNIGLEVGQLAIVAVYMVISGIALNLLKIKYRDWVLFVSGAGFGIGLILAINAKFW